MKLRLFRRCALSSLLFPVLIISAYADSINMGTAGTYAVLAGTTVTNTGTTTINGDLGISPGCALTGGSTMTVSGTINLCNPASLKAQNDLITAYNQAAGLKNASSLTGTDLGGLFLKSGVYSFTSSAGLAAGTTLTLEGTPGARFVFQIGTTLTTGSASSVIFINSLTGKPMTDPHIYWQVGSSATLGTSTRFEGNILALTSITLNTGATINCGSALARNGAVALQGNTITNCGSKTTAVPEPGTMSFMGMGLLVLVAGVRRRLGI